MTHKQHKQLKFLLLVFYILCECALLLCIGYLKMRIAQNVPPVIEPAASVQIMDRFDSNISDTTKQVMKDLYQVKKIFWVEEDALAGPVANPMCYGTTSDPSDLSSLLDEATALLDGQETLFSTDVVLKPESEITYYLDETIMAITWKQIMDDYVYTISEIKVAHPSQFRRYVADGVYDSPNLYPTTVMAQKVNAVVASSADHYRGRIFGTKVYDGKLRSVNLAHACDVCYINRSGDLIFSYKGEMMEPDVIQNFIDDNDIQFSISFGPILVDDGVRCEPKNYALGEVNGRYARAALCQMGPLHYLVVVANSENQYFNTPTIHNFAENIAELGCEKAYAMDGGNTGSIAMNGKLINITTFGYERHLSDIIYFCTAIPNLK